MTPPEVFVISRHDQREVHFCFCTHHTFDKLVFSRNANRRSPFSDDIGRVFPVWRLRGAIPSSSTLSTALRELEDAVSEVSEAPARQYCLARFFNSVSVRVPPRRSFRRALATREYCESLAMNNNGARSVPESHSISVMGLRLAAPSQVWNAILRLCDTPAIALHFAIRPLVVTITVPRRISLSGEVGSSPRVSSFAHLPAYAASL